MSTDIIDAVGYADQTFQLQSRQELSRLANGTVLGKDFGNAMWAASYTTQPLRSDDALRLEAMLNALDGVIGTFEAYDLRRPYPRLHADGIFSDTGTILSVSNPRIALKDLDPGMQLSAGDYLSFEIDGRRVLHQIMEDATADGGGETGEFAVRPHLWAGTEEDLAVRLKKPSVRMALAPNAITTRTEQGVFTTITFKAMQV